MPQLAAIFAKLKPPALVLAVLQIFAPALVFAVFHWSSGRDMRAAQVDAATAFYDFAGLCLATGLFIWLRFVRIGASALLAVFLIWCGSFVVLVAHQFVWIMDNGFNAIPIIFEDLFRGPDPGFLWLPHLFLDFSRGADLSWWYIVLLILLTIASGFIRDDIYEDIVEYCQFCWKARTPVPFIAMAFMAGSIASELSGVTGGLLNVFCAILAAAIVARTPYVEDYYFWMKHPPAEPQPSEPVEALMVAAQSHAAEAEQMIAKTLSAQPPIVQREILRQARASNRIDAPAGGFLTRALIPDRDQPGAREPLVSLERVEPSMPVAGVYDDIPHSEHAPLSDALLQSDWLVNRFAEPAAGVASGADRDGRVLRSLVTRAGASMGALQPVQPEASGGASNRLAWKDELHDSKGWSPNQPAAARQSAAVETVDDDGIETFDPESFVIDPRLLIAAEFMPAADLSVSSELDDVMSAQDPNNDPDEEFENDQASGTYQSFDDDHDWELNEDVDDDADLGLPLIVDEETDDEDDFTQPVAAHAVGAEVPSSGGLRPTMANARDAVSGQALAQTVKWVERTVKVIVNSANQVTLSEFFQRLSTRSDAELDALEAQSEICGLAVSLFYSDADKLPAALKKMTLGYHDLSQPAARLTVPPPQVRPSAPDPVYDFDAADDPAAELLSYQAPPAAPRGPGQRPNQATGVNPPPQAPAPRQSAPSFRQPQSVEPQPFEADEFQPAAAPPRRPSFPVQADQSAPMLAEIRRPNVPAELKTQAFNPSRHSSDDVRGRQTDEVLDLQIPVKQTNLLAAIGRRDGGAKRPPSVRLDEQRLSGRFDREAERIASELRDAPANEVLSLAHPAGVTEEDDSFEAVSDEVYAAIAPASPDALKVWLEDFEIMFGMTSQAFAGDVVARINRMAALKDSDPTVKFIRSLANRCHLSDPEQLAAVLFGLIALSGASGPDKEMSLKRVALMIAMDYGDEVNGFATSILMGVVGRSIPAFSKTKMKLALAYRQRCEAAFAEAEGPSSVSIEQLLKQQALFVVADNPDQAIDDSAQKSLARGFAASFERRLPEKTRQLLRHFDSLCTFYASINEQISIGAMDQGIERDDHRLAYWLDDLMAQGHEVMLELEERRPELRKEIKALRLPNISDQVDPLNYLFSSNERMNQSLFKAVARARHEKRDLNKTGDLLSVQRSELQRLSTEIAEMRAAERRRMSAGIVEDWELGSIDPFEALERRLSGNIGSDETDIRQRAFAALNCVRYSFEYDRVLKESAYRLNQDNGPLRLFNFVIGSGRDTSSVLLYPVYGRNLEWHSAGGTMIEATADPKLSHDLYEIAQDLRPVLKALNAVDLKFLLLNGHLDHESKRLNVATLEHNVTGMQQADGIVVTKGDLEVPESLIGRISGFGASLLKILAADEVSESASPR